ncbi:hypothetical protein [Desulfosporosinus sp. BICA1-9]|uniref:hypothetical protein n=1 Tax=Desulfosporosinus sp. BICA1-9 TaxID=1531958 RepID=UPI00054BEA8F|nr:hypothetical protein [Desulfosporosinus sp. BICA1-9]KJS86440.1 MAG: hypothetical protein JL57_16415 [Desulfosporosinus sp. BICA1-9]
MIDLGSASGGFRSAVSVIRSLSPPLLWPLPSFFLGIAPKGQPVNSVLELKIALGLHSSVQGQYGFYG